MRIVVQHGIGLIDAQRIAMEEKDSDYSSLASGTVDAVTMQEANWVSCAVVTAVTPAENWYHEQNCVFVRTELRLRHILQPDECSFETSCNLDLVYLGQIFHFFSIKSFTIF